MNKRAISYLVYLLCLTSCMVKKSIPGNYVSKGSDYRMDIELNQDSSFYITYRSFEVEKKGKGSWKMQGTDSLLLTCRDINPGMGSITQNYLAGDTLKFLIQKNGKLKYYKAILKKVK